MIELTTDPVCSQSALPLAGAQARQLMAPWGYPPTRAPLATIRTAGHDGDLSAQFTLGWIYEHGADVPQDYREAIDWYRRAATHGEPEAINTVGLLYYYGKGVPKDPREATIWFHQAAELGHAMAQWNLAGMYYRGDGAPHDDTQAERWCRRAAEQDCPPAQNTLANIYHDGRGVAADYTEAATWYRRAAAQGFAKAQWNLAEMYYVGRGVARDYAIGDVWCRQAAAQGHERAQAHLDVITAPPPPGPFDPPDLPAPTTGGDFFDRVRRNRIRLERGAAEVDAILDRVLPRAHQLDASFDRIDAATRRLDNIIRRAEDLERDHVPRRQGLFKTIHALSDVAERAQRRIQAITAALKARDKETRAIEARLRQTMIDRTVDPDGPPAAADAAAADPAPEDQTSPTTRS